MKDKIQQWVSIKLEKNPAGVVLFTILLFNIIFFLIAAWIISHFSLNGTESMTFIEAAFCTITMILDAGCVQFVIQDIGQTSVYVCLICLIIILIGMLSFTGAVIGYITNYISNFIGNANAGNRKLNFTDHFVILNWNTRGSEIVNDLLYYDKKQVVVILVESRKKEIEKEIEERLSNTIIRENLDIQQKNKNKPLIIRLILNYISRFRSNVIVIVREGNVFSSKQLADIQLSKAQSIIILGGDINNSICKFEKMEFENAKSYGNSQTIKTLMQVADITGDATSADNQKITVEITDDVTHQLVNRIIQFKQVDGKSNIVAVPVNKILGQILSQISIMPELNLVYKELFSNKGLTFYFKQISVENEENYIDEYFSTHQFSIPLTKMESKGKEYFYYAARSSLDIDRENPVNNSLPYKLHLKPEFNMEEKHIIIIGHNSKCDFLMQGYKAFVGEWGNPDKKILHITVIDDEKHLKDMDYYREYDFVDKILVEDKYNHDEICKHISDIVDSHESDTSILLLSDDSLPNEDLDANVLTNLVYVEEIISKKKNENPLFDENSMDVIVEIIDPKHFDIVSGYSFNNVVISNRYISKMITQIGEKEALFDFYSDILTYDEEGVTEFESKEIYAKKVSALFSEVPAPTTAQDFIRTLYEQSIDPSLGVPNPTIALGYVDGDTEELILFGGHQNSIKVELKENDRLIVFSNH